MNAAKAATPDPTRNPLAAIAQQVSALHPLTLMRLATDIRDYVNSHPEAVDTARLMGGTQDDLVWALLAQHLSAQVGTADAPSPEPIPFRRTSVTKKRA